VWECVLVLLLGVADFSAWTAACVDAGLVLLLGVADFSALTASGLAAAFLPRKGILPRARCAGECIATLPVTRSGLPEEQPTNALPHALPENQTKKHYSLLQESASYQWCYKMIIDGVGF
jgi:hypothetical protein